MCTTRPAPLRASWTTLRHRRCLLPAWPSPWACSSHRTLLSDWTFPSQTLSRSCSTLSPAWRHRCRPWQSLVLSSVVALVITGFQRMCGQFQSEAQHVPATNASEGNSQIWPVRSRGSFPWPSSVVRLCCCRRRRVAGVLNSCEIAPDVDGEGSTYGSAVSIFTSADQLTRGLQCALLPCEARWKRGVCDESSGQLSCVGFPKDGLARYSHGHVSVHPMLLLCSLSLLHEVG